MAKALAKGSRISGAQRATLASPVRQAVHRRGEHSQDRRGRRPLVRLRAQRAEGVRGRAARPGRRDPRCQEGGLVRRGQEVRPPEHRPRRRRQEVSAGEEAPAKKTAASQEGAGEEAGPAAKKSPAKKTSATKAPKAAKKASSAKATTAKKAPATKKRPPRRHRQEDQHQEGGRQEALSAPPTHEPPGPDVRWRPGPRTPVPRMDRRAGIAPQSTAFAEQEGSMSMMRGGGEHAP